MNDNTAIAIIALALTLGFTSCSISNQWTAVEVQKLQLEREKLEKQKQ